MYRFRHLCYSAKTDPGLVRENNEDAFGAFPSAGIFCVADGMGGGDDGEYASSEVVSAVSDFCGRLEFSEDRGYPASVLVSGVASAINTASARIFRHAKEKNAKLCGSTFVGMIFDRTAPETAVAVHAGDSRLYQYRDGVLSRLTRDHSVAEIVGANDESEIDVKFRGMIVRAVGTQDEVDLERNVVEVHSGDRFLLCSDGLTRMVSDARLSEILAGGRPAESTVEEFVEAARLGGGLDNITVVLVDVGPLPSPLTAISNVLDAFSGDGNTEVFEYKENSRSGRNVEKKENFFRMRRVLFVATAMMAVVFTGAVFFGAVPRKPKGRDVNSPVAYLRLAAACDGETIARFTRVIRLLDRHGVPEGFEDKARDFHASADAESAADFAKDVLLSVKSGVDYARDCAESPEPLQDVRTVRLRKFFATLSSDVEMDPGDSETHARCAHIIRAVAGWH